MKLVSYNAKTERLMRLIFFSFDALGPGDYFLTLFFYSINLSSIPVYDDLRIIAPLLRSSREDRP